MLSPVIKDLIKWTTNTDKANEMIEEFKNEINKLLSSDDYSIFFTSSIYESNSWIISSAVRSFKKITNKKPHIIAGNNEPNDINELLKDLSAEDVDISYIPIHKTGKFIGSVDVNQLESLIQANTCLITVNSATNEGIINDIQSISEITQKHNKAFHSDISVSFPLFSY